MHGEVFTTGWLMYVLLAIGIIALLAALYLIVDALRRPAAFAGLPETRWSYLSVSAIYIVAYGAWSFLPIRAALPWVGDVVLAGVLAMFVASAAYLLRVVFPKSAGSEDPDRRDGAEDHV